MRIFSVVGKEFIYGGHLQSLGTLSVVLLSAILLKINITFDILIISYLLFYPLYLYNRYKEIKVDYVTNAERTKYLQKYIGKAPFILLLVIAFLIISLFYFRSFNSAIFVLVMLILGLFYSLFFKSFTKRIPLFKNFYVASFFAVLVFLPIVHYSVPLTKELLQGSLVLFLFVFLKAIMMQIFLDLKDIASDKKEGLATCPVILGKETTIKLLQAFSVLVTFFIPVYAVYLNVFPKSALLLLATVFFDFYCFELAKKNNYTGYLLMSGIFIPWFLIVFFGKLLWIF